MLNLGSLRGREIKRECERETESERKGGKKQGEGLSERHYTFYHLGEMRILQVCRFQVGFRSSFW
jgi:hypothetical protein